MAEMAMAVTQHRTPLEEIQVITSESLNNFFGGLQSYLNIIEQHKNYTNKFMGTGFNVFGFIGDEEDRISDVIEQLLNPNRGHGQGAAFLCCLLDLCSKRADRNGAGNSFSELKQNIIQGKSVKVKREYETSKGRSIDIVVDVSGFKMGIENKPWARDLENQVHDYVEDLKKSSGDSWAFIYLNGYGKPPSEESLCAECRKRLLKSGHYVELDYANDLAQWAQQCALACEADKIRWFLRDFRAYALREFKSTFTMESDDVG